MKLRLTILSLLVIACGLSSKAWLFEIPNAKYKTATVNFTDGSYQIPDQSPYTVPYFKYATLMGKTLKFEEYNGLDFSVTSNMEHCFLAKNLPGVAGSSYKSSGLFFAELKRESETTRSAIYSFNASAYIKSVELTYTTIDNAKYTKLYSQDQCDEEVNVLVDEVEGTKIFKRTWRPYFPTKNININLQFTVSGEQAPNQFVTDNDLLAAYGAIVTKIVIEYADITSDDIKAGYNSIRALSLANEERQLMASACTDPADVNSDNLINSADVVSVYNSIISGGTAFLNGHALVDLGLPSGTCWASTNLGATLPESHGDYYAYNEQTSESYYRTKSAFSAGSYKGRTMPSKGEDLAYTQVTALWGAEWEMPSRTDWNELINPDYTEQQMVEVNGVAGMRITSLKNGNSIFLPAGGACGNRGIQDVGLEGNYWSSTSSSRGENVANAFSFDAAKKIYMVVGSIYFGHNIRPVCKRK